MTLEPPDKNDPLQEDDPLPESAEVRLRGTTTSVKTMRRALMRGPPVEQEDAYTRKMREKRPKTRGDCENGIRPCPWVSCRHHLYLDVNAKTGSLSLPFPDKEPGELQETCSLDVADRDGQTLEQIAEWVGVTRERIRQIQDRTLVQLRVHNLIDSRD